MHAGLALLTLVGAAVSASDKHPPRGTELVLPLATTPARTTLTLLADGHTALVTIRDDGPAVQAALASEPRDGIDWSSVELPRRALELELRTREHLVAGDVTTQGKRAAVRLWVRAPRDERTAHLKTPLTTLGPRVFAEPQLAHAEKLLAGGLWDEATIAYQEAAAVQTFAPWAGLRLADVAVLRGEVETGCAAYGALARQYPERTVAVLALLRAHAATCSDRKTAPQILDVHETWAETTENIARFLMDEAAWTLGQTHEPEAVAAALDAVLETPARTRRWQRLHHRWLARRLRTAEAPALLLSLVERYRPSVLAHPEAADLLLRAVRAAHALGLPEETLRLAREATRHGGRQGAAWQPRAAAAQLAAWTVLAHRAAEDRSREAVATKRYVQSFGPLVAWAAAPKPQPPPDDVAPSSLAELERRVVRAELALAAERRRSIP